MNAGSTLLASGFVVLETDFSVQVSWRARINAAVRSFPEFLPTAICYSSTGDGCVNTPSSFHHPTVRELRAFCYAAVRPVLQELAVAVKQDKFVEVFMDSLVYAAPGMAPRKRHVSRADVPYAQAGDLILSSWINLDTRHQVFDCVVGSHQPGVNHNIAWDSGKVDCRRRGEWMSQVQRVTVPPGHIILYFDNLLTQSCATARNFWSCKLHTGYRLCAPGALPLIPHIALVLSSQAVPQLKSGDWPRVVQHGWALHSQKIAAFVLENVHPSWHMWRLHKGKLILQPACDTYTRVMPPPASLLYPVYSHEEALMYFPHRLCE